MPHKMILEVVGLKKEHGKLHVDPELVSSVLAVMRQRREAGMTMLVVTHEMGSARRLSDRVIFMDGGVVAADDTPDKIFSANGHERMQSFLSRFLGEH